jgi:hypothetical protein
MSFLPSESTNESMATSHKPSAKPSAAPMNASIGANAGCSGSMRLLDSPLQVRLVHELLTHPSQGKAEIYDKINNNVQLQEWLEFAIASDQ